MTTQKTLADELGYSVGKINYVLKALASKGLLKVENFYNNHNKKQYRYLLTPKGLEEKITLTQKFIERKKAEYEALQNEENGLTNIILCGTRLWPISRALMPKQFVKLFNNKSLFQLTVDRNSKVCDSQFVVSNAEQYFLAIDQLEELNKTNIC